MTSTSQSSIKRLAHAVRDRVCHSILLIGVLGAGAITTGVKAQVAPTMALGATMLLVFLVTQVCIQISIEDRRERF